MSQHPRCHGPAPAFLLVGIALLAIGLGGTDAFIGIGAAFIGLGLALRNPVRKDTGP